MKTHKYFLGAFLLIGFCLSPSASHADMFGNDDKKWERVFSDLKKISVRLTDNVDVQLKGLQASQAELLSQINNLKSTIPALQGAVEQSDAKVTQRFEKMEAQLAALEMKVKAQLDDQKKSQQETANTLRQGLAVDMDNLAKRNSEAQTATLAGFANMDAKFTGTDTKFANMDTKFANIDANNKKMIEILAKTLQENQDTGKNVGMLGKNLAEVSDQTKLEREMLTKLKEIVSVKLDSIGKEQTAHHTQADTTLKTLDGGLKGIDEKTSQSIVKIDAGIANVDLANQKLSKLIEILRAFAVEQEKIVKTQADIAREQEKIVKTQADMAREQEKIVESQAGMAHTLADIQTKAGSQPAKSEGKKNNKKEKAATSEGKHKKAAPED